MKRKVLALLPFTLVLTACSFATTPKTTTGAKETTTAGTSVTETTTTGGSEETTTSTQGPSTTTTTKPQEDHSIIPEYDSTSITLASPDFTTREIPNKDAVKYDDLFNLGNQVSISIDMEDEELEKLQEDLQNYEWYGNKNQLYRRCRSVTITLKNYSKTFSWTIEDVGIRQKGNTSRKEEWPIIENGEIVHLNHFKLSFDETFDDEAYGDDRIDWTNDAAGYKLRKDREFLGLTGLDLKWNKNYDATHIKEIYASKLYKAAGLISQNTGLANFEINQVDHDRSYDMGLYTIYEPAKKSLIKRNLQDNEIMNFGTWNEEKKGEFGALDSKYGDLYKCGWGIDLTYENMLGNVGVGSIDGAYVPKYERKTNTSDTTYDDDLLLNLGWAVSTGKINDIRKCLDIEYFAATEAVNYFVGNPDDLRNNTNNTMIYLRRTDGMGVTIPIDNDRAFGITTDWNVRNGMTEVGPMDRDKATSGSVISLYTNTILKNNSAAKKLYLAYITAFYYSDWLKDDTFNSLYNIAKNTYSSTVSSDFDYIDFNLTDSNVSFSNYIQAKKQLCVNYLDRTDENNQGQGQVDEAEYGDIYLIGSFCGWNNSQALKFNYTGNGVYSLTFTPTNLSGNSMECKIFDGQNYNRIDWTLNMETGEVITSGSRPNFTISGINNQTAITITIDTNTMTAVVNH